MQINDSFVINAPQDKVWEFLFDISKLYQCVPGIESAEAMDDKTYRGKLVIKVGPIRSEFGGTVTLTEVEAPNRIAGMLEGDDKSSASSVKATFTGTLTPVDGGTEAAFQVEANLRGRLAQFGGPVITATAKKLTAEFAKNLRAQLE
ncbi:MAG: SRPBCC family protein [Chloroflexi bacterium]|nr:SRPBCC family protein [Chloroflexota bacterium]MBI3339688.1 SRPBCC family protein [Chloroflexota bacterium]